MSLRLTEEEFAQLQARRTGSTQANPRPAKAGKAVIGGEYDLLALGQLAMVKAQTAVPASPPDHDTAI